MPEGFYNIEVMMGRVVRNRGEVGVCGTCMDARAITDSELMGGKKMSAKGGGMGCMMMKKKSASAEQDGDDTSSQEEADTAAVEPAAGEEAGKSSDHEGHH